MKRLFQVTCPREILYRSKSFAYQIKPSHCVGHECYKILVIHERNLEEKDKCYCFGNFSVVTRYYSILGDGSVCRNDKNFTWNGNFETYKEAENKVKELVMKRGSGTEQQWEKFFKARVSKKRKKICVE